MGAYKYYNPSTQQWEIVKSKSIIKPDGSLEYTPDDIKNLKKGTARFVIGTSTAGWTLKDCDYLCDGTADDVEINAAITALPATGGEIVILDGTYNITAKIDVTKDNVSIRGNGNATILKRMFNSSVKEGVITLTSRSGCKIADLQVDGNKGSYTNYTNFGILLNESSSNTVTDNTCNNSRTGILLNESSSNTVTDNTCNNGNTGILLNESSSNTVTDNTCNNNSYGIYLFYSSNNTVTGNNCDNNDFGINLESSSNNNTITGNTCSNNNDFGIYLDSASNSTITGNTCSDNQYSGIYLFYSSNNTITGNTCIRGTGLPTDYTASQHTIRLMETDNTYNLISNNNCMGKAVTNEGGTGNTLVNNKFDDSDDIQALVATQAEAETGTNNTKMMTHLRVAQAIDSKVRVVDGGILEVFVNNEWITFIDIRMDDKTQAPGSKFLIGGTMNAGFFGEVAASELFTASEIASACGISQGTAQFENEPWLKFAIDGKIIFRPRKAIRHSISWDSINAANCVYGGSEGKRVTKDGQTYIVRLMKGALTDPSLYDAADRGAKGSEWNRLMLPIHEQTLDDSWAYPEYVEDNVPIWNHNFGTGANGMYTDSDLQVGSGNGRYVWCQETRNTDTARRVFRGYGGVSHSNATLASDSSSDRDWSPVLELIS